MLVRPSIVGNFFCGRDHQGDSVANMGCAISGTFEDSGSHDLDVDCCEEAPWYMVCIEYMYAVVCSAL